MPLHTADALVLRTYKLGEADRIVVFLTRDRGKKRGVAKGARRVRSRFLGSLECLTLGRVTYFEHEQRDLVRIDEVEVTRSPLAGAAGDGLSHVGYFAELLDEWAPEAAPNEKLFRLGAAVAEALGGGAAVDRLARYFEYWLLRLEGLYPSVGVVPGLRGRSRRRRARSWRRGTACSCAGSARAPPDRPPGACRPRPWRSCAAPGAAGRPGSRRCRSRPAPRGSWSWRTRRSSPRTWRRSCARRACSGS